MELVDERLLRRDDADRVLLPRFLFAVRVVFSVLFLFLLRAGRAQDLVRERFAIGVRRDGVFLEEGEGRLREVADRGAARERTLAAERTLIAEEEIVESLGFFVPPESRLRCRRLLAGRRRSLVDVARLRTLRQRGCSAPQELVAMNFHVLHHGEEVVARRVPSARVALAAHDVEGLPILGRLCRVDDHGRTVCAVSLDDVDRAFQYGGECHDGGAAGHCLTYAYSLTGRSSLVGAEYKSASQRASETECARSAAAAATPTESSLWTTHRSHAAVHTAALAAAATEGGGGTDARDVSGEAGGGGAPGVGVVGLDRA